MLDTYGNELDETDENESGDDEMLLDKYLSNFIPDDLDGNLRLIKIPKAAIKNNNISLVTFCIRSRDAKIKSETNFVGGTPNFRKFSFRYL